MDTDRQRRPVHEQIVSLISQDPGLPRKGPSVAFWQEPTHPIANVQSPQLPRQVDIVIVGSGITGCSVARTLLENPRLHNKRIALFEARALTSGATGRNGGHLVSPSAVDFAAVASLFGAEKAAEVTRFSFRNLERFHAYVSTLDADLQDAAEARKTQKVMNFLEPTTFDHFQDSLRQFSAACPELADQFKILSAEEAKVVGGDSIIPRRLDQRDWQSAKCQEQNEANCVFQKYRFKESAGACEQFAGAVWPYRTITGVFAKLLNEHASRFSIETNTPVTAVTYDAERATHRRKIHTPRGVVYADQVVYCTNAYTSHLLPQLRGKVFPFRGTMSTQSLTPSLPNHGARHSWSIYHEPTYDPVTGVFTFGLYYMTQNAKTGDFFFGGEQQRLEEILVSDDTVVPTLPAQNLVSIMENTFTSPTGQALKSTPRRIWSGIMGFTPDGMPLVGRLGRRLTGRPDDGEWAAVGFNGYGMDKCWLVGELLGAMVAGEDVTGQLPSLYQITDERLDQLLAPRDVPARLFRL
ncbi:hypothetical protein PDE_09933 [Penicillium oxalicum 114-2]|uniref:FAD dependent oxidoreductase domain-containing protein n=1 Tax=Penicillium oxalicum (strain 114-2 / CGMCC 5302) TaxID=933388 RepID=S8B7L7_PENO1|nr:hypothetical protein PDE_09933 [Penicillium oxalicum 114-2]